MHKNKIGILLIKPSFNVDHRSYEWLDFVASLQWIKITRRQKHKSEIEKKKHNNGALYYALVIFFKTLNGSHTNTQNKNISAHTHTRTHT